MKKVETVEYGEGLRLWVTREIQDYLGVKQWLAPGTAEVMAVRSGKGKHEGNLKGELTVQFTGQCFACNKAGH